MPYASNEGVRIHYEGRGRWPAPHHGPRSHAQPVALAPDRLCRHAEEGLPADHVRCQGTREERQASRPGSLRQQHGGRRPRVLDHAGVRVANYFGYSMGAGIGFKEAVRHPDRSAASFSAVGTPIPHRTTTPPTPASAAAHKPERYASDPQSFLRTREQELGRPMTLEERQAELSQDPERSARSW